MSGRREVIVFVLATIVLVASIAGALQIADVRRADDEHAMATGDPISFAPTTTQPDADRDGVPDATDACPTRAETFNGFQDQDGCPDVVTRTRAS